MTWKSRKEESLQVNSSPAGGKCPWRRLTLTPAAIGHDRFGSFGESLVARQVSLGTSGPLAFC